MKFCKDCVHSSNESPEFLEYMKCYRPTGVSLSTGEPRVHGKYCDLERNFNWLDALIFRRCGKIGRFFKEKE